MRPVLRSWTRAARRRTLVCDVTDAGQVKAGIEALARIDVLVNNAGMNIPEDFLEVSEEHLDRILALNVKGAFLVAQAAARRMVAAGGGSIVNISSQMGHVGYPRRSVYCMSKHALEGLTKALAVELAPQGIRVNTVAPTFAETPMTRPFFEDRGFRDEVLGQIPIGRLAKVEDIMGAIVFLASPAAAMITGTSLLVDGGWTAQVDRLSPKLACHAIATNSGYAMRLSNRWSGTSMHDGPLSIASPLSISKRALSHAVHRNKAASTAGMLERCFTFAFKSLVYPQIWEDPAVDMAALALGPDSRVVTIASGGCNVLAYLTADPAQITAVDLNRAHIALTRIKVAAALHLPNYDSFYRFFGEADHKANLVAYKRFLRARLDPDTLAYWQGRDLTGRRRITLFSRDLYHHGLLGYTVGLGHLIARAYGIDLKELTRTKSLEEQRTFFDRTVAPLFDKRLVKWVTKKRVSLYGLGIPPAQYEALAAAGNGDMAAVLRGAPRAARLRLCDVRELFCLAGVRPRLSDRRERAAAALSGPGQFRCDPRARRPGARAAPLGDRPSGDRAVRAASTLTSCSTPRTG